MEHIERLPKNTSTKSQLETDTNQPFKVSNDKSRNSFTAITGGPTLSPTKCSISKKVNKEYECENSQVYPEQLPVSILKSKNSDIPNNKEISLSSFCITVPAKFPQTVRESAHKRHGILKKRSSLDECEILNRRCRSPDVTSTENDYPEFRPILKNQRRSSLDEIVKRSLSPDSHPTSILKRKSSREDSFEDRLSPEPQGILKKKYGNNVNVQNECSFREFYDSSEVRPILKKKHSREESSSSDSLSVDPRPILKKKSSTDSDEHDDKPKKTILKFSRKHSQDGASKSDQKLSSLRYRLSHINFNTSQENDCIRPILKQSNCDHVSRSQPNFSEKMRASCVENDIFSRKRAQSMGHVNISTNRDDCDKPCCLKLEASSDRTMNDKIKTSHR